MGESATPCGDDRMIEMLKEQCRFYAVGGGKLLESMMISTFRSIQRLDMMRFVTPVEWCISQRRFQLSCVAISMYLLYFAGSIISGFSTYGLSRYQTFRLEAVGQKSAEYSMLLASNNITIPIRLLRRTCVVWAQNVIPFTSDSLSSSAVSFSFPRPVEIDGFSAVLDENWRKAPVLLVLKGSNDNGTTWQISGSTSLRMVSSGVRYLDEVFDLPTAKVLDFEAVIQWPLIAESPIDAILIALCALTTSLFGALNKPSWGKSCFKVFCLFLLLNSFVCLVGYTSLDMHKYAFAPATSCLVYSTLVAVVTFSEALFTDAMACVGALSLLGAIIRDCVIFRDPYNLLSNPPISETVITLVGAMFVHHRQRQLNRVLRSVKADQEVYEAGWKCIQDMQESKESIHRLQAQSALVATGCTLPAVQLNRLSSFQGEHYEVEPYKQYIAGTRDADNPVRSLSQLYSQAFGVVSHFYSKCREWAKQCNGTLDDGSQRLASESATEAFGTCSAKEWINRRFIKHPERAVEKVLLCYKSDVSRLLDICRGRIIYSSMGEIANCVDAICGDSQVKILRIKNSLHGGHNSTMTAGFRGVIINLCVDIEDTRCLGCENHACELQLLLKSLHCCEGLSPNHHTSYLAFRAVRTLSSSRVLSPNLLISTTVHSDPSKALLSVTLSEGQVAASAYATGGFSQRGSEQSSDVALLASDAPDNSEAMDSQKVKKKFQVLRMVYVRNTLRAEGYLDRTSLNFAFRGSNAGSVLFSSTPLAAAGTKRIFQLFMVLLSGYFMYATALDFQTLQKFGIFWANVACFEAVDLRNNTQSVLFTGTRSFGLLKNGCEVDMNETLVSFANTSCVKYQEPVESNGYFFTVAVSSLALNPIRWVARMSSDNRNDRIDESVWKGEGNGVILDDANPVTATGATQTRINVDGRPPWPTVFFMSTRSLPGAVLLLWTTLEAALGRLHNLRMCMTLPFSVNAALEALVAVGYFTLKYEPRAAVMLSYSFQDLGITLGIFFYEAHITTIIFVYGACNLITTFFQAYYWDVGGMQQAISTLMDVQLGYILMSFSPICILARKYVLSRSRQLVLEDKRCYDETWIRMMNECGSAQLLSNIQDEINLIKKRHHGWIPRQLNRQCIIPSTISTTHRGKICPDEVGTNEARPHDRLLGWMRKGIRPFRTCKGQSNRLTALQVMDGNCWVLGGVDPANPVQSVDQLFMQATLLHPILLDKVQRWALATGGCFPLSGTSEFVKLASVQGNEKHIKFANVKSVERAIEKIFRVYHQDVSKLLDACRQSIIFEGLPDLLQCLKRIGQDPEVKIVRIKNRMDACYDSTISAGYRDIVVNIRVDNPQTRDLGVETHVCEVQLLLKSFAILKNDSGHSRYVSFRNLRGE